MFVIELADLPIGIETKYEYTEKAAKDYITDKEPLFTVDATAAEIEEERRIAEFKMSDGYLESIVICRKIANELPKYNAALFHGASFSKNGRAYIVTARSGTGKTTHMRLWLKEFEGIEVINGDKPIVRLIDGVPYIYGSPWQGKENYGKNAKAPLDAIGLFRRGIQNKAYTATSKEALVFLASQMHFLRESAADFARMAKILDTLLKNVKLYNLECNMESEAAHVAHDAFVYGKVTD